MVKNPPFNAEDAGSNPGQGTKIPHASEQLSPLATIMSTRGLEPMCHNWRSLCTSVSVTTKT